MRLVLASFIMAPFVGYSSDLPVRLRTGHRELAPTAREQLLSDIRTHASFFDRSQFFAEKIKRVRATLPSIINLLSPDILILQAGFSENDSDEAKAAHYLQLASLVRNTEFDISRKNRAVLLFNCYKEAATQRQKYQAVNIVEKIDQEISIAQIKSWQVKAIIDFNHDPFVFSIIHEAEAGFARAMRLVEELSLDPSLKYYTTVFSSDLKKYLSENERLVFETIPSLKNLYQRLITQKKTIEHNLQAEGILWDDFLQKFIKTSVTQWNENHSLLSIFYTLEALLPGDSELERIGQALHLSLKKTSFDTLSFYNLESLQTANIQRALTTKIESLHNSLQSLIVFFFAP